MRILFLFAIAVLFYSFYISESSLQGSGLCLLISRMKRRVSSTGSSALMIAPETAMPSIPVSINGAISSNSIPPMAKIGISRPASLHCSMIFDTLRLQHRTQVLFGLGVAVGAQAYVRSSFPICFQDIFERVGCCPHQEKILFPFFDNTVPGFGDRYVVFYLNGHSEYPALKAISRSSSRQQAQSVSQSNRVKWAIALATSEFKFSLSCGAVPKYNRLWSPS